MRTNLHSRFLFVLGVALVLGACKCQPVPEPLPPLPPVPPMPDGGALVFDDSSYGRACTHLHELGCPEGDRPDCARVMATADARHLTLIPVACITTAPSVGAVRGCGGFVKCPGR